MKPVNQTVVDPVIGDCHRAVVASLLELDIDQVPNFIKFGNNWFDVYWYFLYSMGLKYKGQTNITKRKLYKKDSINGYFDATVKSKTFEGVLHGVVIDMKGVVVHDPNPNKRWQGINVLKSGELISWYMFGKVNKRKK